MQAACTEARRGVSCGGAPFAQLRNKRRHGWHGALGYRVCAFATVTVLHTARTAIEQIVAIGLPAISRIGTFVGCHHHVRLRAARYRASLHSRRNRDLWLIGLSLCCIVYGAGHTAGCGAQFRFTRIYNLHLCSKKVRPKAACALEASTKPKSRWNYPSDQLGAVSSSSQNGDLWRSGKFVVVRFARDCDLSALYRLSDKFTWWRAAFIIKLLSKARFALWK